MTLEKDIHQFLQFRNEHHKALVNLIFTCNWAKDQLKQIFDEDHLTLQQYSILLIVNDSAEALSTLEIRERMLDRMSDTSRIVDRLVAKRLLSKKLNKLDKRLVVVSITPTGKQLLRKMERTTQRMDAVLSRLSAKECVQFNTLLDKLRG